MPVRDHGTTVTLSLPLNRKKLGPTSPERVRRLRKHLIESLRAIRTMKDPKRQASALHPGPEGFAGQVAQAACTLCRGWCCKGGGEHAYLDERTLARVRFDQPELDARAVLRLYIERVPSVGYEGSCIYHGEQGCTLTRELRSGVCNLYFCGDLGDFVGSEEPVTRVELVAEADKEKRRGRVVAPRPQRP